MNDTLFWPILLGALGLTFGSFIATAVIRWPVGASPLNGRSRCDRCDRPLRAIELVPLLSYLVQRGKCRHCGAAIAPVHPLIELLALAIGVCAGLVAPGWAGAAGAAFGWILLLLAGLDIAALWLPNIGTGVLAVSGIATGLVGFGPVLLDRLIGGIAGFATLWAVSALYRLVRGRVGLGGGDPKLLGAIGLWLGWQNLPALVLGACIVGLIVVAAMLIAGRRDTATIRLPFGAMLAVAAFPLWCFVVTP